MQQINVLGEASGKEIACLNVDEESHPLTLMEFLLANNIPIASSCLGEGVCSRCEVNQGLLSCQITVGIFIKRALDKNTDAVVHVDYL